MPEHAADGVALADEVVVVVEVVDFDVVVEVVDVVVEVVDVDFDVEDEEDEEEVELGVGVIDDEAAGRHCESVVQLQLRDQLDDLLPFSTCQCEHQLTVIVRERASPSRSTASRTAPADTTALTVCDLQT